MKRRLGYIAIVAVLVTGLAGCGSQVPDMTEEQRTAISEYAVELLLKYDTNSESRLVDLELLEQEPEPTATPAPTEPPVQEVGDKDPVTDVPVSEPEQSVIPGGDVKAALGLEESISFSYEDYLFASEYADKLYKELTVEAGAGKQLLVCNFVLVNDGAKKQSVDMLRDNIKYTFIIGKEAVNAQVTMLSNDLATYMGILDTDEARKVVLLAESDEENFAQAESIYLQIQRGEEIATIQIK